MRVTQAMSMTMPAAGPMAVAIYGHVRRVYFSTPFTGRVDVLLRAIVIAVVRFFG
jgi:hypothetical protein